MDCRAVALQAGVRAPQQQMERRGGHAAAAPAPSVQRQAGHKLQ